MITHLFNLRPPIDCMHTLDLTCNSKDNCQAAQLKRGEQKEKLSRSSSRWRLSHEDININDNNLKVCLLSN